LYRPTAARVSASMENAPKEHGDETRPRILRLTLGSCFEVAYIVGGSALVGIDGGDLLLDAVQHGEWFALRANQDLRELRRHERVGRVDRRSPGLSSPSIPASRLRRR